MKFRLYPTKKQEKLLFWTLARCRELYNAALQERKEAYEMAGTSISYYEQKRDLVEIKAALRPEYQVIPAFRVAIATTVSPIPRQATASRMIIECASLKSVPSK